MAIYEAVRSLDVMRVGEAAVRAERMMGGVEAVARLEGMEVSEEDVAMMRARVALEILVVGGGAEAEWARERLKSLGVETLL